ncbi:hydrogenase expression/formation protein HypE [Sulfurimicrobium lacus]|uniref:Hydrogenase expression/formation protein HypE n=1 Tax=Sulfurimicrobium lacus TaxID=2715678 RepID=A0A6F8VIL8_9PROT|nr:hydrogenase expression/formation protein HypE [Sulfurimicrobium lacus]BCB28559.1 hydrogenase expression/formation protein HypE [Sulfurimicrobium lacus]
MSKVRRRFISSLDLQHGHVSMAHGSGGRAMAELVEELFLAAFDNEHLRPLSDHACFTPPPGRLAIATDSHVVTPLFFPGGDIGSLSVHSAINNVAMAGALPLYLTAGFILEEGFPLADLKRIVDSMAAAARAADVSIVSGDTKVVERGKADGVFINTTGVGVVPEGVDISGNRAQAGDKILINGFIGDHGMALMAQREKLKFETPLLSDSAALHDLVAAMLAAVPDIHCLRDPTRGGVAAALNELARQSRVGMLVRESALPIREAVSATCELLDFDPLYVANAGKLLVICPADAAETLLAAMRGHPLGEHAAIIGDVTADSHAFVQRESAFGVRRMVDWLSGEQLPRIC